MRDFDLTLDIETIPTTDKAVQEEIKNSIAPPGNYKSEEAIEKWWSTKGVTAAEDKVRKTALDGSLGEVITIAWAFGDNPVNGIQRTHKDSEGIFLTRAFSMIAEDMATHVKNYELDRRLRIIGHNILKFDIPFLWKRCVINEVFAPSILSLCASPRQNEFLFDTQVEWMGSNRVDNLISCDKLCRIFKIDSPKTDKIDGSKVYDHWVQKKYDDILAYCKRDVEAERAVAERILNYA